MTSLSKSTRIAALRRYMAASSGLAPGPAISLGTAINAALPWGGLPTGCVHEVAGSAADGAATGFCAALLASLAGGTRGTAGTLGTSGTDGTTGTGGTLGKDEATLTRPVLWICAQADLYGPGLAMFGLPLDRLIVARARRAEAFWAIEEALNCTGLAAVVGEVEAPNLVIARRLQLVARKSGVTAILLRQGEDAPTATAVTRWRLATHSAAAFPRWRVDLMRCRGRSHTEAGYVERWLVEWRATGRLALAPALRDGSALSAPRRAKSPLPWGEGGAREAGGLGALPPPEQVPARLVRR